MTITLTIENKIMEGSNHVYNLDVAKCKTVKTILQHAQCHFNQPYLYHFTAHIHKPDQFNQKRFIQNLQRKLQRQYRQYFKQRLKLKLLDGCKAVKIQDAKGCPDFVLYYSIEHKAETIDRINGDYNRANSIVWEVTKDYLHIHIHIVFNMVSGYIPQSISGFVLKALNDIDGLQKAQYHRRHNGQLYHNLNHEFNDAFARGQYLCKTDQKSEDIPFRKTFGYTQVLVEMVAVKLAS